MDWNPRKILRRLIHMGRLSSDDERPRPHVSMGIMTPPAQKVKQAVKAVIKVIWRPCDQCGYSKVDGGEIARAKYQVEVPGGTLYFCGHHFREHAAALLEKSYPIHDIQEKVAAG
jgi:hypothetical protein